MKKAYTLVEVLMGLVIVGILSAILVPMVYNTYGNKVTASRLKKTCVQVVNAAKHVMVDEHVNEVENLNDNLYSNTAGFYITSAGVKTSNATKGAQYFLEQYIKNTDTNCGQGGSAKCVASAYRAANGTALGTFPTNYYCVKTNNEAAVCAKFNTTGNYMVILIDVNGGERPNTVGTDVFVMRIADDGQLIDLVEDGSKCNVSSNIAGESSNIIKYAAGCFHKILGASWRVED